VWFTETNTAQIGAATTAGVITQYTITAPSGFTCVVPQDIIVGPDGNLWSATFCGEAVSITPSGHVTVYGLNGNASFTAIAVGPDKNLWLGDQNNGVIDVITPAGSPVRTITLPSNSVPTAIALGPDGNMWVANFGTSSIDRVTTTGTVTAFASGIPTGDTVRGITAAPDGNLYFTAPSTESTVADNIGKITTTGTITMLGSLTTNAAPVGISADTQGNVWFREDTTGANALGRVVTATGTVTEYALAGVTSPNVPDDGGGDISGNVIAGPGGNLWLGGSGVLYVAAPSS